MPQPPVAAGSRPELWVALEDHLGRDSRAPLLKLISAGAPFQLKDADNRIWTTAAIRISWRNVPLESPINLARQVAGPFASFESAERVANRWRAIGVPAEVAHPGDWEVWAPMGSPPPADVAVRPWSGRVTLGSAKVAESAPSPGAVLPQLVHGGPGRAGGGEELGGERGMDFYLQRTAVQGYRPLVERLFDGT